MKNVNSKYLLFTLLELLQKRSMDIYIEVKGKEKIDNSERVSYENSTIIVNSKEEYFCIEINDKKEIKEVNLKHDYINECDFNNHFLVIGTDQKYIEIKYNEEKGEI